ncbi:DUF3299 domain-containing protein [Chitinimonas koreensis]|uniref:DUF3299 domain-containing protein n=1 Tax=Chitinimonas koreensis TaxID=356302 RepID=UPI00040E1063|nr:DUF3299 domain-containing protein [Chitinimonas koreensis]QNM95813.1 DUF3299 domain-containing protein [Chitinimonas koreensis]
MLRPALALLAAGLALAADPSSLPAGPAPVGGAGFGVTAPSGKPLADRGGFVSWNLLAQVEAVPQGNTHVPRFDPAIRKLDRKTVKLQGFMLPLGMGEMQNHFVLTATPPTCAYCLPGGPDSVIEVKTATPVRFGYEPIAIAGKFELLSNDPMGLYYRITEAKPIN